MSSMPERTAAPYGTRPLPDPALRAARAMAEPARLRPAATIDARCSKVRREMTWSCMGDPVSKKDDGRPACLSQHGRRGELIPPGRPALERRRRDAVDAARASHRPL